MSIKIDEKWLNEVTGKYKCPFCEKEYTRNGISTHIWRTHGEGKTFTGNNDGYKDGTRKGTNQYVKSEKLGLNKPKVSESTRRKMSESSKGKQHTTDTKEKLSRQAMKNGLGGVTQSRWITYKGKTLGSSYELTVVKDLDDNCIRWDTCNKFKYIDDKGKCRTYTPDIYLIDYDVYLDPKNDFLIENINPRLGFKDCDKIKWVEEQNNIKVFVLNKTQLNWEYIKTLV